MSNFDVSYCAEADLRTILPNIADYDKKRVVSGWSSDSALVDRYKAGSTGTIDVLYKDGVELGAAESSLAGVTSDDKWYYDSDTDTVYFFNDGEDPNGLNMESGTDWATLVTSAISKSSEITRAIVGKPIIKHSWGTRDYDEIIVSGAASLAVGRLVRPHDGDLADRLERVYNYDGDEFPKGFLQSIRDGQISLSDEITPALSAGILVDAVVNSLTTGGIEKTRGVATVNDTLCIEIVNGGNAVYGVSDNITYRVTGKDSEGLQADVIVETDGINGDYQSLGGGIYGRFAYGTAVTPVVYTTGDKWYLEVSKEPIETHQRYRNIPIRAV